MISRAKMCLNKVSFRNRGKAEAVALRFGQRVYECPICFCWHCTNKENWRDEFVDVDTVKKMMHDLERGLRTEYNEKLREKNVRIAKLRRENQNLRMGYEEQPVQDSK